MSGFQQHKPVATLAVFDSRFNEDAANRYYNGGTFNFRSVGGVSQLRTELSGADEFQFVGKITVVVDARRQTFRVNADEIDLDRVQGSRRGRSSKELETSVVG